MAGAGYKLFNTGDVLTAAQVNTYLMEQTVMVFADAAARTTALSGVVSEGMISYLKDTNAVEVYNGSAWVASDDPNAIQNTIVDAKGDLITATAADTPARLAVGSNGETLVADSAASTGLRWQGNYAAGKNKIINSDFSIWQRGTSFSNPADQSYTADRWEIRHNGTGATRTISRETFTPGAAPVAGYEGSFFFRYAVTGGTGNTFQNIRQKIEDVRTFAGQTVTLSFWAKAGSNVTLNVPGLEQNFGSGGSASAYATPTPSTYSLTTSWQRFSVTYTVPSISGKTIGTNSFLMLYQDFTAATAITFDIWGVQVEAGNVATAFQTATGTLQGEIALAQRYYYRINATASAPWAAMAFGSAGSTTLATCYLPVKSEMRVIPTSVDFANLCLTADALASAQIAITNATLLAYNSTGQVGINFTATGLTQYRPYTVHSNNNSGGYLGVSAEL